MHWWIVIMCSEDYYILYEGCKVLQAETVEEAKRKALESRRYDSHFVEGIFGPFDKKPDEHWE